MATPETPPSKHAIAAALEEIGLLLELLGENPFKTRAYEQGARALERLDQDLGELLETGRLGELPGFGKALVDKIGVLHSTGRLPYLDDLRAKIPKGLRELVEVPGLGPKKARLLHDELGLTSLGELEYACHENRLLDLKGFGEKTQAKILAGLTFLKRNRGQRLYSEAAPVAADLAARLAQDGGASEVVVAGQIRRRLETVDRVVLVARTGSPEKLFRSFESSPGVVEVMERTERRRAAKLESGLRVELELASGVAGMGAALLMATGSEAWVDELKSRAASLGFVLDERGVRRDSGAEVGASEEREVLAYLGLPWVEPELREEVATLSLAARGELPLLLAESDVRGVLHAHTRRSDGADLLETMVAAAEALGLEYLGVSDHSQTAVYAHGMKAPDVSAQHEEMAEIQAAHPRCRIFRGVESDIHPDGSLDYPDSVLETFDFVIASVHSSFAQSPEDMTRRLVRAVSHPATRVLGHPTGRLLLSREGYRFDLDEVLAACAEHDVAIELNAHPHRLDLDWRHAQQAVQAGVRISIGPDAHRARDLSDFRYGVGIARKGRLRAQDVINALDAAGMAAFLSRSDSGAPSRARPEMPERG